MSSAPLPPKPVERLSLLQRYSIFNKLRMKGKQKYHALKLSNQVKQGKSTLLRQQTWLIFCLIITSLIGTIYTAAASIFLKRIKEAEAENTRQAVQGVLSVFKHTENELSSQGADWAGWDDSYTFITNSNQRYIEANLQPEMLANLDVNVAVYIDTSAKIIFGTGVDVKNKTYTQIPEALLKQISLDNLLLNRSQPSSSLTGIILLPEAPMVITSQPILTSKREGPSRGSLVFGRTLDTARIQKLAQMSRYSLSVYGINHPHLPRDFQAMRPALSAQHPIQVQILDQNIIAGYALLTDIYSQPAVMLRVDVPRDIYKQGEKSLHYFMGSLSLVVFVFGTTIMLLLERFFLLRLEGQEKEKRYRTVVAQVSEGIFLIDADTKHFLEANPALQNLLGYSAEELLKLTVYDVFASDKQSIDNDIQPIKTKKHRFNGERRFTSSNGTVIDVEVSANLIDYDDKDALCIVVRDISDRKQAEEALQATEKRLLWEASHDSLTELLNRREFEELIEQAIISARNCQHEHALLYLDLDQFKIVNDTCGHVAGDQLLRQISVLFQNVLQKNDILARLGGDEFGVLLDDCSLAVAMEIADKLREEIQHFRFPWHDKTFAISVSIGLVAINADSQSKGSVLSAADIACYAAKNKGRNRVHIYQVNDIELEQQRGEMHWVSQIPKALEENRFRLYYQRIVPIDGSGKNKWEHYEILLRLEDENGKIVSPMAFIPAAERYNLMHLIDRWVIAKLFAYLGQQYQQTWEFCQITNTHSMYAVNLSGASLNDEGFVDFVKHQFEKYQLPPYSICFEVTETVAITNLGKAAQLIHELKELGCQFALDDFGSGMSSFAYLKNLPVDYLKIDGVFIKDIVKDAIASEMVDAINRIASVMDIQTIAEFVENEEILMKLKSLGVDYAQGYGIGKPCPLNIELD